MTHYETLGVKHSASADEVKRAFREKARTAHPDKGGTPAQFRAIEEARRVLADPMLRAHYDESLASHRTATSEVWRAVEEVVGPIDQDAAAQVLETLFGDMLDRAKSRVQAKIQEAIAKGRRR